MAAVSSSSMSPSSATLSRANQSFRWKRWQPIILGVGVACWDRTLAFDLFPTEGTKVRTSFTREGGGGNCANSLCLASQLGCRTFLVTRVSDDSLGHAVIEELDDFNVDTSLVDVSGESTASSTIIVAQNTGSRTILHTHGQDLDDRWQEMWPAERRALIESWLSCADHLNFIHVDGRNPKAAAALLTENAKRDSPCSVSVEAERPREGLTTLLAFADIVFTSQHFPKEFTHKDDLGLALHTVLKTHATNALALVTTLGAMGAVCLERLLSTNTAYNEEEVVTDLRGWIGRQFFAWSRIGNTSDTEARVCVLEVETVRYVVWYGPPFAIPGGVVKDSTGAGDAFIGAALVGLCKGMSRKDIVRLGNRAGSCACACLGAKLTGDLVDVIKGDEGWVEDKNDSRGSSSP